METCSVVLTSKSVDKILWCDYLNETSLAVFLNGTIFFSILTNFNFDLFFWNFCVWHSLELKR